MNVWTCGRDRESPGNRRHSRRSRSSTLAREWISLSIDATLHVFFFSFFSTAAENKWERIAPDKKYDRFLLSTRAHARVGGVGGLGAAAERS